MHFLTLEASLRGMKKPPSLLSFSRYWKMVCTTFYFLHNEGEDQGVRSE